MTLAVNEIAKKPRLISDIEDIVYIKDKRKDELKSIVIPAKYLDMIKEKIEDIEYELWLKRNEKGLAQDLDGLFDEAIEEIGDKL
jgi:hypothetical protein